MRYLSSSAVCVKIINNDAPSVAYAWYEASTVNGVSHCMW